VDNIGGGTRLPEGIATTPIHCLTPPHAQHVNDGILKCFRSVISIPHEIADFFFTLVLSSFYLLFTTIVILFIVYFSVYYFSFSLLSTFLPLC
jgi:hypothetical protein